MLYSTELKFQLLIKNKMLKNTDFYCFQRRGGGGGGGGGGGVYWAIGSKKW